MPPGFESGAYIGHVRHRCGVPARYRTIRCCRRRRIGHPRRHGSLDVGGGDGRLRSGVRGQRKEQRKAREAVRPPRDGPSAQEAARRVAAQLDALQRGMCSTPSVVQRRAPTNQGATLMDARYTLAHRNTLVARTLSAHATPKIELR